jgi:thiamine-monophosphate kinase
VLPPAYTVIGLVAPGEPEVLVDGRPWSGSDGWRHFTR